MRQFVLQGNDEAASFLDLNDWQNNGIAISKKDLGNPTVREVIYDHSDQDGSDDQTRFLSQRVVSLTGKCFGIPGQSRSRAWLLLQPFLDPAARSTLFFQMDDDDVQNLSLSNLRVSQYSKVASSPTAFDFSIQFKCDPAAYGPFNASTFVPTGLAGAGRAYPLTFNRVYPSSGAGAPAVITSAGTFKTWPIYRIHGPCTNPYVSIVVNNNTSQIIGQFGLLTTIPGGQYIEVDSHARTVLLGGVGGSSRYSTVDFANTNWVPMQPGANTLIFTASVASAGCMCQLLWADAYMV
jgi:hypothetical protein